MKVFIETSSESLDHMSEIALWLEEENLEPVPWNLPTLFPPGENPFLKLIEIRRIVDAAIFVFAEDDMLWYRADRVAQLRDNVFLEYGFFVGALWDQSAPLICRIGHPKAATDLQGINWIDSPQVPSSVRRFSFELGRNSSRGQQGHPIPEKMAPQWLRSEALRRLRQDSSSHFGTPKSSWISECYRARLSIPSTALLSCRQTSFLTNVVEDERTAAGAFVTRHFPNQKSELRQAVHGRLGDPVELVEKPGRAPVPSFGVGSCVYLDRPLGNKLRLIFAAVASDRPPDGPRTDLLTIFKVIEKLRGIVAEERVPSAAIQ